MVPTRRTRGTCSGVRRTTSEVDEDCELAELGIPKRPAVVRVQSFAQAEEIASLCDEHGWQVIVGVEPREAEHRSDTERLLGARAATAQTPRREPKVGRTALAGAVEGKEL